MRHVPTPTGPSIAVHKLGEGGQPMLLCHATGFHGRVWAPLAAAVGGDFERWAVDFRGHGASITAPGSELAWTGFGEDVLASVDGLDLAAGQMVGVGHSMGGAALLLAEQARPGTFAGLWLYEPITPPAGFFPSAEGGNRLAEGAARRRSSFASHTTAVANYAAKPPLDVLRADTLHAYVQHGFIAGDDGEVHLACRAEDEAQIFRGGGAHGAFAHLGSVACPVVVACGREEPGPVLFAPAVVEALPNGRLERHSALGHFGPLEAPGVCAEAVRSFARTL